jgi:hypothetical protein
MGHLLMRGPGEPVRVAAVAIAFLLGGCGGLGPRTIPADQIDYSNAIGEASKQQVLLNVVKLRFPGGASNDMNPNLQDPANPLPLMDLKKTVKTIGLGD